MLVVVALLLWLREAVVVLLVVVDVGARVALVWRALVWGCYTLAQGAV